MKVGDLVELSACAEKRKGLQWLRGYHGIVIEHVQSAGWWKVHWFGKPTNIMKRKDIKHA